MIIVPPLKEYIAIQVKRLFLFLFLAVALSVALPFFYQYRSNDLRSVSERIPIVKNANNGIAKIAIPRPKKEEGLYHPIIVAASDKHQVDAALVKAIILVESNYNPLAVSKKGAIGLMQLMPQTANDMGVDNVFDPEHNINGGVRYLKQLIIQFNGDVQLAVAAYNAGSKKVQEYGGVPPFRATRYYVTKVYEYYLYYKEEMKESDIL